MMISRRDQKRKALKRTAITSTIAVAAGYVAGILTAPKSGKQTREDLKTGAEHSRAEAEKDLKHLHTELDKVIKQAKTGGNKLSAKAQQELKEALKKAKTTKQKTREVLSAVHEGDADDKDLARAVKNANTALKSLRVYLKK